MIERLQRHLLQSRLADPARWLYRRFWPLSAEEQNSRYDAETRAVMARVLQKDSNCVDVGAHAGAILQLMIQFAPAGRHMAFEPLPELAAGLRQSFPEAQTLELALSDRAGQVNFQRVVTNPGYSGILRRAYPSPTEEVQVITVHTERLDVLVPSDRSIAFIKIDVEGAEMQVLRGAVGVIQRCRPFLVFEHGLGAADHYGTSPAEVYDFLAGTCGLRVTLMRRWLTGRGPLSRAQFITHFDRALDFYYLAHP